jgi:hypothetical protein
MIWQKASLGSQFERFLATEKRLKFLKKNSDLYDSLAQLVEQYTFNVWVLGSSPRGITITENNGNKARSLSRWSRS